MHRFAKPARKIELPLPDSAHHLHPLTVLVTFCGSPPSSLANVTFLLFGWICVEASYISHSSSSSVIFVFFFAHRSGLSKRLILAAPSSLSRLQLRRMNEMQPYLYCWQSPPPPLQSFCAPPPTPAKLSEPPSLTLMLKVVLDHFRMIWMKKDIYKPFLFFFNRMK